MEPNLIQGSNIMAVPATATGGEVPAILEFKHADDGSVTGALVHRYTERAGQYPLSNEVVPSSDIIVAVALSALPPNLQKEFTEGLGEKDVTVKVFSRPNTPLVIDRAKLLPALDEDRVPRTFDDRVADALTQGTAAVLPESPHRASDFDFDLSSSGDNDDA